MSAETIIDPCCEGPEHEQVSYTTKNGIETEVDLGLSFTLELLKRLGVETYYSCEDNYKSAYILGCGVEMFRLEREIKRLARQGRLSRRSRKTAARLFGRKHTVEISHFRDQGTNLVFQMYFGQLGYNSGSAACVTKMYSTTRGFRIDWRWPGQKTHEIETLLDEVYRLRP